jgi:hypothetical protein
METDWLSSPFSRQFDCDKKNKSLECLLEITFLDALCTELCLFCCPICNDFYHLQVWPPFFFSFIIGVAHIVANLFSFSAHLTNSCHLFLLTGTLKKRSCIRVSL